MNKVEVGTVVYVHSGITSVVGVLCEDESFPNHYVLDKPLTLMFQSTQKGLALVLDRPLERMLLDNALLADGTFLNNKTLYRKDSVVAFSESVLSPTLVEEYRKASMATYSKLVMPK